MNDNIFRDNFVINPFVEVTPTIRISPFREDFMSAPNSEVETAKGYLNERFASHVLTVKGRNAIELALSQYDLCKDDIVTILTTSENFYISSCVTKSIEKYCSWSRKLSDKTKLIFVNHEFGYPYPNLSSLQQYNLPIIEDCAHSFLSKDKDSLIGEMGDFVIYSLPKFFPMQLGGILASNRKEVHIENAIDPYLENYIWGNLSVHLPLLDKICETRLRNYEYLKLRLSPLGIQPFFPLEKNVFPGVFLFRWYSNINYSQLKDFMQHNGIESSVFYGQNAFFIPCHQNLHKPHLDYMIALLNYFYNDIC